MEVSFSPVFLGFLRTLSKPLQDEVLEKVDLFAFAKYLAALLRGA